MNALVIGIILVIIGIVLFMLYLVFGQAIFSPAVKKKTQLDKIMKTQRGGDSFGRGAAAVTDEPERKRLVSGSLTLAKKMRYARWKMPPLIFRILQVGISVVAVLLAQIKFDWPLVFAAAFSGPVIMNLILHFSIDRRFGKFDKDYPAFLLNVVSMLKIGMNVTGALQSASEGLDQDSLVREEVDLMLDRLKMGVSEEKSIGAFGEDILHPEIELFVQAVILSRRLGGNLSETLERLAAQVRSRQHFRQSAKAAVGLQRGSIGVILCIMVALELYIYFTSPELITSAFDDPLGWLIWQGAIVAILIGIYWVKIVTNIKI